MEVKFHIDRPAGSLINNISQEFTGWLSSDALADEPLEATIDGAAVEIACCRREDVEQRLPGKRVIGWAFHLDPARTFGQTRRTLELKLRLGDRWSSVRHYFKSKNLMPANRASPLFFMHIPKTAGTALRQFVDVAFSEYPSLLAYGDAPGVDLVRILGPLREFAQTRELFFGHYDLNFALELYEHDPKIVTIFRDPRELTRSYLEFAADPAPQLLDNPLTRHVCGLSYAEPFGLVSQEHLETALGRIHRHVYILQQDRLQEYADHVCQLFGLPHFAIPRINAADAKARSIRTDLPVDIRYDMQLYAACRDRPVDFLDFLNA